MLFIISRQKIALLANILHIVFAVYYFINQFILFVSYNKLKFQNSNTLLEVRTHSKFYSQLYHGCTDFLLYWQRIIDAILIGTKIGIYTVQFLQDVSMKFLKIWFLIFDQNVSNHFSNYPMILQIIFLFALKVDKRYSNVQKKNKVSDCFTYLHLFSWFDTLMCSLKCHRLQLETNAPSYWQGWVTDKLNSNLFYIVSIANLYEKIRYTFKLTFIDLTWYSFIKD